jgi:hypothetical protein
MEAEQLVQEAEAKAKEISQRVGRKVFAILLPDMEEPGKFVTGYAYEPDLQTQLKLMDRSMSAGVNISIEACSLALETLILPAETDPRMLDKSGTAVYWKGACFSLSEFMTMTIPVFKKK